jgi:hypothetical protein
MNRLLIGLAIACFGVGLTAPFLYPTVRDTFQTSALDAIQSETPSDEQLKTTKPRHVRELRTLFVKALKKATPKKPASKGDIHLQTVLSNLTVAAIHSDEEWGGSWQKRADWVLDQYTFPVRSQREIGEKTQLVSAALEQVDALATENAGDPTVQAECAKLRVTLQSYRTILEAEEEQSRRVYPVLETYFSEMPRGGLPKDPKTGAYPTPAADIYRTNSAMNREIEASRLPDPRAVDAELLRRLGF